MTESNTVRVIHVWPECSYGGCEELAVWTRKPGWAVAPGSPEGDVCEEHHCWEAIKNETSDSMMLPVEWDECNRTDPHRAHEWRSVRIRPMLRCPGKD